MTRTYLGGPQAMICSACGAESTGDHVCVWSQRDDISLRLPADVFSEAQTEELRQKIAGMARGKGAPKKARERARILELSASGLSWAKIAKQMNKENPGATYNRNSVRMAAK